MFVAFTTVFILAAVASAGWLISKKVQDRNSWETLPSTVFGIVALCLWAASGLLLLLSSLASVPANEVGIVTNFGRWAGTLDSGIHVVAPWSQVDTFPTRNQKSIRDEGDEGEAGCVQVKLKGDASACVDLTVLYTIDSANAEVLWRGWGSFSKLNKDLIERATDDAVNEVLSKYPAEELTANRAAITEATTNALAARLHPQGVRLESVTFGTAHVSEQTQRLIDSVLAQDAKVLIAQKEKEEATAKAEAAKARQIGLTPEALVVECLNAAREIKPLIINCGLGGATEQPSLIVTPR